jgi:hypothetical protein
MPYVECFHLENILSAVTSLRNEGTTASSSPGTANRLLSGEQCLICVVRFLDGAVRAVRIPVHTSHLLLESIANYVETQVSIMKRLETSRFS